MRPATRTGMTAYTWLATACVVVIVFATAVLTLTRQSDGTTITAYFDRAVGLYEDSSVRVLGVDVGTITEVRPMGSSVRVTMVVEDDVPVPADAGALVVAPSLVSDRYIQLTPAYENGERMRSGATIPSERTATPVELDDLFANLDELATTLGPDGANSDGALSGALDTLADNLEGNGQNLHDTVSNLAQMSSTFDNSKGDLFGTIKHLGRFTEMLANSDRQVDQLYGRVADVTKFLADESGEVDSALSTLAKALKDVRGFVDDNDELLSSNVDDLTAISKILVDRGGEIAETLDTGPTGLNNFINAYDAASGTIAIRGNLNELTFPPVLMVCRLLAAGTPRELPSDLADTCKELAPVLDGTVPLPTVSEVMASLGKGEPPPLPLPLVEAMTAASGGGS